MASPWTVEQYLALVEAIATGAMEVEYDGKRVKYRSLAQMLDLKAAISKDLGLDPTAGASRAHYPTFCQGTDR